MSRRRCGIVCQDARANADADNNLDHFSAKNSVDKYLTEWQGECHSDTTGRN